jgi:hypothetical protein
MDARVRGWLPTEEKGNHLVVVIFTADVPALSPHLTAREKLNTN